MQEDPLSKEKIFNLDNHDPPWVSEDEDEDEDETRAPTQPRIRIPKGRSALPTRTHCATGVSSSASLARRSRMPRVLRIHRRSSAGVSAGS